jgi:hypothetical protein
MTFLVMAYLYVSPMQPAGTVLVKTVLLDNGYDYWWGSNC